MKKTALLLVLLLLVSCLCACTAQPEDYSDGDGNSELISMENKKVSTDDIEFNVVSADSLSTPSVIKTYRTEFTSDDFSAKFQKVKGSGEFYVAEEDLAPVYPEKTLLPEYNLDVLFGILNEKYLAKYETSLSPDVDFVSQPKFSTRSFTGKLVVTYVIYSNPTVDELGVACYESSRRVTLTCDLYDFKIEE